MKIPVLFLASVISLTAFSQTKTAPKVPVKKAPVKTVASTQPLKTLLDSASYAMGMSFATFYKQQGIKKVNIPIVTRAINDVFTSKKPLMDDMSANSVMNNYMNQMQQEKSRGAIDSGAAFLAKNKTKPGVITTGSGLQYEILRQGTGPKPAATDSVTCNYKGTLLNGFIIDDSYSRGAPITFSLRGVIPGWTEGVQLMNEGSKFRFYIPYNLAYGAFDYGQIPGGSMLTFDIELLAVKKNPAQ